MKIQVRTILVIIVTNLLIIAFSILAGNAYTRRNIERYIESDMTVVADAANQFLGSELNVLRSQAGNVAGSLSVLFQEEWAGHLERMNDMYPRFTGMAALSKDGQIIAAIGEQPADASFITNEAAIRAFEGELSFSTSIPRDDGVVFYITAPIPGSENCAVVLTLPGIFFTDLISGFRIWNTGHIFIDDSQGTVLANVNSEWVFTRQNYIELSKTMPQFEGVAAVIGRAITGEQGIGRFSIDGNSCVCAFRPISGSNEGWVLGVIAMDSEGPQRDMDKGFLVIGLVGAGLSLMAALIASGFIRRPFEQIAALKEKAEANSVAKSNFLANMSHEIRTPVGAIVGMAAIGRQSNDLTRKDYCYDKIEISSRHLLGVISDILDMSKIEADKLELSEAPFSIEHSVKELVHVFQFRFDEKRLNFSFRIDKAVPRALIGDSQRLKQVIGNLLANAVKFTPEKGNIRLEISLIELQGDSCAIKVSVSDSGIGITPEQQAVIFDPFQQAEAGTTRKYGGTGLGLSISKSIVEMMGGTISVSSEIGKGAAFIFTVKLKAADNQDVNNENSLEKFNEPITDIAGIFKGRRIILAEDVDVNREIVQAMLEDTGVTIDCAENGAEAVQIFSKAPGLYSLIFMDVQMPEMDGYQATRLIRGLPVPEAKTVPIIAMTANVFREDIQKCMDAGMNGHIGKPINFEDMFDRLRENLNNER